jgi:hypothetical protein
MSIVLINQSTKITDTDVEYIAEACDFQLQNEVAEAWDIKDPLNVTTTSDPEAYPFFFVDDIPEAPGALANLKQPFDIGKGGYQIRMKGGTVSNKFGSNFNAKVRAGISDLVNLGCAGGSRRRCASGA